MDRRDAKPIWEHIHTIKNKIAEPLSRLPVELKINNRILNNSHEITCSLNEYSRLSLSRIPRDSLKYFEISVPRHIGFAEFRKN